MVRRQLGSGTQNPHQVIYHVDAAYDVADSLGVHAHPITAEPSCRRNPTSSTLIEPTKGGLGVMPKVGKFNAVDVRRWVAIALLMAGVSTYLTIAASIEVFKAPPQDVSGKFAYQEVVQIEAAPAAELYSRAKAWGATAYRSMKDVQQLDDKDAGRVILKGNFTVIFSGLFSVPLTISHTLTIEAKDGRYRYQLTDFAQDGSHGGSYPLEDPKVFKGMNRARMLDQVCVQAEALIASMKSAMAKPEEKW